MIELKLKQTALRWDFSFFAVLAVFFIWDYSGFGFAALGICTAHELAHLAVMRLCGMSPDSLTFYGAGIRLSASAVESAPPGVQAAVYAAGCAMNLLLGGVFLAAGEARIAAVSFAAGAFNLLPLGEFDGRRLLKLLLISRAAPENVDTILVFEVLYFLTLIYNLMQVKLANPIELLRGGNVGEKEPKSKWLIAIIGLGCLAGGYYIAITTKSPLQVLSLFFVAVLLVIIGTYLLFISGSIVILKALRKNKKFYYNKKHFAAVSGMIYRMKQNAGGLASICVLSTMVLVVVSTTVSMYAGMEGELKQRYPSDISVYSWYKEVPADVNLDDALKEAAADSDKIIADSACNVKDSKSYTYFSWTVFREGTEFKPVLSYDNDISLLYFVTGDEIDEMETGFKERLNKKIPQLDTGSVAVYGTEKFNGDIINLLGKEFKVAAAEKTAVSKDSYMSSMYSGVYYVVVDSKATLAEIFNLNSSLGEDSVPTMLNNEIDYNLYGSSEDKLAVAKALDKHFEENSVKSDVSGFYEESRDANREQIYVLYGGLFFIGIFLGTMFLMVTVMIIFYKQISEGYDDKARYEIMEKVGMSNDEVKKSITSQVRMVFFLPIILAACHLAAAFPLLRRLLVMFNLTDVKLIAICMSATFLVFVAIYYIVFKITSRAYYRIVGNQI